MVIALAAVAIMVAGTLCSASGQEHGPDMRLPSARENIYQGYNFVVDPETGDTMTIFFLRPFTVYPPMKFRNKKEEEFYWRTVRNVKVTLPYAKMIRETLIETYEYIETFDTQKEREQYLKRMERNFSNSTSQYSSD